MALKIIGAGFGRTGTHSLKSALELLGFGPCHHMYEVRRTPEQIAFWTAAAQGEPVDWDLGFAGYQAQVDWPAAHYWEALAAHFPEAKIILTTREPEAWYASISSTILPATEVGRTEDPDPLGRAGSELIYKIALQQIFSGRLADKAHALEVYATHLQKVRDTIPASRLLVYDVRDGWGPLCNFLCVPQQDQPFPTGNSTAEFLARKTYLNSIDYPPV